MDVRTENEVYENPSLNPLPEAPEGPPPPSPSRGGSPVSPVSPVSSPSSIHRLFSFKSGFERLNLRLSLDLPSERAPSSAIETEKSIASPMEQQPFKALSNPPPKSSTWEAFFYGGWTVELLAFVVSFASIVAIIILLRRYNGHAQPDWPHNITLNSVLSWFSTLFKASLLVPVAACFGQASWAHYHSGSRPLTDLAIYDSASRGPIGSVQPLWYFKAKYVASIGAIATVLALGVDPIIQQTISINAHVVNSTKLATIGRAQSFLQWDSLKRPLIWPTNYGVPENGPHLLPPTDMIAAMFDGMFSAASGSDTSSSSPNLSCPTGNCTFPPFKTLAVCSECEDITNALNETCYTRWWKDPIHPHEPLATVLCEYSLPNGLKMNKTFGPSTVATNGNSPSVAPQTYSQSIINFTGIWSGAPSTPPDLHLGDDMNGWENASEAILSTKDVAATQCFLYWCVNTIKAVVTNGQSFETKMDSWQNNTAPLAPLLLSINDVGSPLDLTNETWEMKPTSNPNDSSFDFVVDRLASHALTVWLAARLTISTDPEVFYFKSNSVSYKIDETADSDIKFESDPSQHDFDMERHLLKTNITAMFETLAASMSHYLRSTSIDSQRSTPDSLDILGVGPANGTATSLEILVSVRWPWLAFPVALLLIALVFFFLTLLSTSRHQLEVWKLSPFPLIFNRVVESQPLPQSEMSPVVQSIKIPDMERKAARISARLEEWDVGPRLTSSDDHLRHMPLQEGPDS
ncbi:hypothetical protein MMC29_001410 [Sticta canariensis]|nr:hypothetical protein [Sticta canariensis]